jgi:hypothetical protein
LRLHFEAIPTTLILPGIDLVIAAVCGVLAARSSPGHAEQEALRMRQQALDAARGRWFSPQRCRPQPGCSASGVAVPGCPF